MADKIVKITFEIDGLTQSVSNIDDAKAAMLQLEKQVQDVGDAADETAKEIKKVGAEGKDAGEATEGAMKVADEATGGLATKVKEVGQGLVKMGKTGYQALLKLASGSKAFALAIASTGIGLLVVALGVIASQWDNILGTVTGVGGEQKKLLKDANETATAQQEALGALEASENSLKLQGLSEKEIRDLKIEQTQEAINALTVALEQQKQVKKSQVEASKRNRDILTGMLQFVSLPITALLKAYDYIMGTDYANSIFDSVSEMIFDPEEVAADGDATIAETEKTIAALRNKKDGFILAEQQANSDAAEKAKADRDKTAADELAAAEKLAAEKKAIADKEAADKIIADQLALDNRAIIDGILQQANLDAIEDTFERAREELRIQEEADIARLTSAGATEAEILRIKKSYQNKREALGKEEQEFNKALEDAKVDAALNASTQVLDSIVNLVGEGSAVGKAAAIASTTISTYQSATAAYASMVGVPFVGPILAPIAAGVAVASGMMSIKKIVSTKTPGNKSAGSAPTITAPATPTAPSFNPTSALNAGADAEQDVNNQVTLGDQTGSQGPSVIRAYVVSSEVSSQQEADAKINDLARL